MLMADPTLIVKVEKEETQKKNQPIIIFSSFF